MAKRDPVLTAFCQSVRKYRDAKVFSQEAHAEKANLDRTYINGIERDVNNHTSFPK